MASGPGEAAGAGFEILQHDTRRGILRALAERLRESPEDPTIGFSDLRRRVGVRDSGNFNYHLEKLRGRFVTTADAGYRLAPAGLEVVTALITGVYGANAELDPVELDAPCPACAAPLTASYRDGQLRFGCPEDHRFENPLPPGAVEDRSLATIIDLWTLTTRQDLELAVEEICPYCYASLDLTSATALSDAMAELTAQCSRCGVRLQIPVVVSLVRHPRVAAFYYDHGTDVRTRPLWAPEFYDPVEVSPIEDGFTVAIGLDGDHLDATMDETLSVLDVSR